MSKRTSEYPFRSKGKNPQFELEGFAKLQFDELVVRIDDVLSDPRYPALRMVDRLHAALLVTKIYSENVMAPYNHDRITTLDAAYVRGIKRDQKLERKRKAAK